jgi:hypothetical protein
LGGFALLEEGFKQDDVLLKLEDVRKEVGEDHVNLFKALVLQVVDQKMLDHLSSIDIL